MRIWKGGNLVLLNGLLVGNSGERLIMVKFVLEGIQYYWLSLSQIPKGTMLKIRIKLFGFLWAGKREKGGVPYSNG
jgi:hypothetical protein